MNEEEKEFEYLRQTSQLVAEFIDFKHVIGDEIDRIHYKMDRQARDIVELRMDVSRIEKKMDDKFYGVDRRLDKIDDRFDGTDRRLDKIDDRFDGTDRRLDGMDEKFDGINRRLDGMDKRLDEILALLKKTPPE